MKKYRSPLRYPGGKTRLIKHLAPLMPDKCHEYREPFLGGGSVFFHARSRDTAETYVLNDAFKPLMNFWESVADPWDVEKLQRRLHRIIDLGSERIREEYDTGKCVLNYPGADKSRHMWRCQAYYFFVVNRCSFSGSTCSGGFSSNAAQFRLTHSAVDRLLPAHEALKGVTLRNAGFEEIIKQPGRDVFIFCDPPYVTASGLYGVNGNLHNGFDHERLKLVLRDSRHRWLLTYDDTPLVRELYPQPYYRIVDLPTTYSMDNASNNTPKRVRELAIMNY